jgi:hypothetical protein
MTGDRVLAEHQLGGDFSIRSARRHQTKHLGLARREPSRQSARAGKEVARLAGLRSGSQALERESAARNSSSASSSSPAERSATP